MTSAKALVASQRERPHRHLRRAVTLRHEADQPRDRDEARDLSQDIFVRVYRNLDGCKDADRFLPWLVRISRNACIDHLRRRKARPPARAIPADEALRPFDRAAVGRVVEHGSRLVEDATKLSTHMPVSYTHLTLPTTREV